MSPRLCRAMFVPGSEGRGKRRVAAGTRHGSALANNPLPKPWQLGAGAGGFHKAQSTSLFAGCVPATCSILLQPPFCSRRQTQRQSWALAASPTSPGSLAARARLHFSPQTSLSPTRGASLAPGAASLQDPSNRLVPRSFQAL